VDVIHVLVADVPVTALDELAATPGVVSVTPTTR
jgi:hypothetical protein